MDFSDVVTLNATPTAVWRLLEDAENLAPCVPGLGEFQVLDAGKGFQGTVSLPFGASGSGASGSGASGIQLPARVEWIEQREPHEGKLRAVARVANQEIAGTGLFQLQEVGEGTTRLLWSATVEVPDELGKNRFLAQLVRNFAVRFVKGFFTCLQKQIAARIEG